MAHRPRSCDGSAVQDAPFVGTEARAAGRVGRHQLRSRFTRFHPNVYLPDDVVEPSLDQRIRAAWLWSQRQAVIAGSAAAFLHGSRWIDREATIELIHGNPRTPVGVIARRDLLLDGEAAALGDMAVTTPSRTGFDIGRRDGLTQALARMDALMRATKVNGESICALASRHPHARGLRQLEEVLSLADPGAESPKESWLRLVLIRAGLPMPHTQIPVRDRAGFPIAYLDLGWPQLMVAVEYDGDHHRTDRRQYIKDIRRREVLERMGWIVITVVAEDRPSEIVRRVRDAMDRRSTVH